tara:strand:- start:640 stop:1242 length:603 start_codon:yes stop_codon:yes gene_type:complete
MKKIKISDCICHSKVEKHSLIRDKILKEILYTQDGSLKEGDKDSYFYDRITKLDWDSSKDFSRPWVKIFLPEFVETVNPMIASMGYTSSCLIDMWYQQYLEGDTHGWHIHGQHFTGVYYLEFPEGCSKTEICSPYDLKSKTIDVVEGDFILFPSHYIHRGLPNNDLRKTIISFNFDLIVDQINNNPVLYIDKIRNSNLNA